MLALRSVRKRLARSIERDRHSQPPASERLIRLSTFQCLHKRNGRVSRLFVHQLETWDGSEPLPILMENAIQIAWDYLERTGELGEPEVASRFLLDTVELMVRRGERRRLFLSNKAIDAYKRFKNEWRVLTLVY